MKAEWVNRYGATIVFESIDGNILMSEGTKDALKWCRFGYISTPSDKELTMVDPSGGPYISIEMDMGYIDAKFEGKIVQHIELVSEGYLIVIKED
jgi:hypothetical protein